MASLVIMENGGIIPVMCCISEVEVSGITMVSNVNGGAKMVCTSCCRQCRRMATFSIWNHTRTVSPGSTAKRHLTRKSLLTFSGSIQKTLTMMINGRLN